MKKAMIAALILLFLCSEAMAKKVDDVNVSDSAALAGQNLVLNGAGLRIKKVVFLNVKVYAAGLYLPAKSSDDQAIINADTPMAIRLYITTGMATKSKLTEAWNEGFERATAGNIAPIKGDVDKFNALFKVPFNGILITRIGVHGIPVPRLIFDLNCLLLFAFLMSGSFCHRCISDRVRLIAGDR